MREFATSDRTANNKSLGFEHVDEIADVYSLRVKETLAKADKQMLAIRLAARADAKAASKRRKSKII